MSRVAKRVGDGMFFGGLATAALGGIILAAEQGDFGAELLIPIVGGVSMVGAMIPWEIQQARIIRGARGGVTLAPTVNGVIGTF